MAGMTAAVTLGVEGSANGWPQSWLISAWRRQLGNIEAALARRSGSISCCHIAGFNAYVSKWRQSHEENLQIFGSANSTAENGGGEAAGASPLRWPGGCGIMKAQSWLLASQ